MLATKRDAAKPLILSYVTSDALQTEVRTTGGGYDFTQISVKMISPVLGFDFLRPPVSRDSNDAPTFGCRKWVRLLRPRKSMARSWF